MARVDEQKLAHVDEQKLDESCEATYTSSPCRSFECSCGGPFRDIYIYIHKSIFICMCRCRRVVLPIFYLRLFKRVVGDVQTPATSHLLLTYLSTLQL